jgi:hypothetical protein
MIGHQHIGVNPTPMGSRRIIQLSEVATIVLLLQKTRLPVVAPLDYMLRHASEIQTWLTRHGYLRRSFMYPMITAVGHALPSDQAISDRRKLSEPIRVDLCCHSGFRSLSVLGPHTD